MTKSLPACQLAWHLTSRCNLSCKHCLRRTPDHDRQRDLSLDECRRVLRSFADFVTESGREAEISFDGRNPLSRPDFLEVLADAHVLKKQGVFRRFSITGNPEQLTPEVVAALREAEVEVYNLSLDGLERTNDEIRGKGNFQALWRGHKLLTDAGIRAPLKMTLFKRNVGEIEDVLRLMLQRGIDSLGVGLLILVGNGEKIRDEELNPQQYRELLVRLLAFLDNEAKDTKLRRNFLRQMPMYGRLFYELGRYDEYRELAMHSPRRGGPEGRLLFVVWPDGEVVPRREMAPVGYVPRQSFSKIYKDSYLLQLFENEEFLRAQRAEKQRDFVRCRECPASERCGVGVAVFSSRLIYYPSPHCWVPIA